MTDVITSGSLRLRLATFLIATGAVMAAVLVIIFLFFARQITTEAQDSQLLASVTSILESAAFEDTELVIDFPYSAFSTLGTVSDDRVFYKIELNGAFLSGYDELPTLGQLDATYRADGNYLGDGIRIVSASRTVGSGSETSTLTVSVAQTKDGTQQKLQNLFIRAASTGLGFFAAATLLAIWVSKQAFVPLNNLAGSIDRRGPSDLSPIKQQVPSEMSSLVGALNEFTSRLKRAQDRSEDFIAEAAHRIRTPLAVVRTKADIARKTAKTQKMRTNLEEVIQAVDESSRAASQLLDHAMVNVRTDAMAQQVFDLKELLAAVLDRFGPVAQMKDIRISAQLSDEVPLKGDAVLLDSAFSNLLDNAIKYSPADSTILVKATSSNSDVQIDIFDQGSGFESNLDGRLFERFQRGKDTHTTVGSGLGLTIARDVINAHQGKIELNNSPEGGACVSVILPLA